MEGKSESVESGAGGRDRVREDGSSCWVQVAMFSRDREMDSRTYRKKPGTELEAALTCREKGDNATP